MIAFVLAAMMLIAGCSSAQPHQGLATTRDPADRPVAIARFSRFTPGSQGTIAGYVRGWPSVQSDGGAPLLTYVIDFQIVKAPQFDKNMQGRLEGLFEAEGVRRIYFHPRGARLAFSDPSRFINGEPVAVDKVKLAFDFPEPGQVYFKILAHRMASHTFDYRGHTATAKWEGEGSMEMFGRLSAPYGGFLLTTGT